MSAARHRDRAGPPATPCATPWPLLEVSAPTPDAAALAAVGRLADALGPSAPVRAARRYAAAFAAEGVRAGWAAGPTLWLEDHRGIELVPEAVARGFEYRSLGLARAGDTLLVSRERDLAFEAYARDALALGAVRVRRVPTRPGRPVRSLGAACLEDVDTLDALVGTARGAGGCSIVPFRSDGHVWTLARRIARAAGVVVHVAAAVPPIARAANDKIRFAALARRLLGEDAVPPAYAAHGFAVAAARLARLAEDHARLVLKTPSSAGALGNVAIEARELRGRPLAEIRTRLVDTLAALGWSGPWPVLVGVWEDGVLASPSVQTWVPPPACGGPAVEGVYEQRLVGERGIFTGATEAHVEPALRARLVHDARQLAGLLQRLGYVGRASFDALLVAAPAGAARVHWIECNARWGGVSIPMVVLRRLGLVDGERATLIAQLPVDARTTSFERLRSASATLAFERDARRGIVWLTPPDAGRHHVDFVAVGADASDAAGLAARLRDALAAV